MAVVTLPVPGEELSASPLFEEDLVLVVPWRATPLGRPARPTARPPDRPLALEPPWRDLELLLPLPGTALRDEIDAAVRPAGVVLRPLDGARRAAA